jgi:hypothetical protein
MSTEYPKIKTIWRRETERPCPLRVGDFACPEFELLVNATWSWTEKVDGTNVRIIWDGHNVTWNGKTDNAQMPVRLATRLQELFGGEANEQVIESMFEGTPAVLYGEGYGAGIQKGGAYRQDVDFILFDVLVEGWWLERDSVEDIARTLCLDVAPEVHYGSLWSASEICESGDLHSVIAPDTLAEGLVGRAPFGLRKRNGERLITKIKLSDFKGAVHV